MLLLTILALSGCDDTIFPAVSRGGAGGADGYCGVQAIFASECVVCHQGAAPAGGLDLELDAHAATVGIASSLYAGRTLVVEGDPDASLLYNKVAGAQAAGEGGPMPSGSALAAEDLEVIRAWIADGASDVCSSVDTATGDYHPEGWEAPTAHGLAAKLQDADVCTDCHGPTLEGGNVDVSCDTCHTAGWREDCTFCHGDPDTSPTGAPPEGIADQVDAAELRFPPHATHVAATELKVAFDCTQCHVKPTDILSEGHVFVGDTSPGVADVMFAAGLSTAAYWNGTNGTCSNLYCHGDGQGDNGTMVATGSVSCGDCHAVTESGEAGWSEMSGEHREHLRFDDGEPISCNECHGEVVNGAGAIVHVEEHVDGEADVLMQGDMLRGAQTCTGTCHGELHNGSRWDE
ncbi:MAG: c-type cytochrome domain-containing protein [Pseudomonadota bacterium]|nr:c-type cytochrome domain-containing protein [Pseudomonadota bacterium]